MYDVVGFGEPLLRLTPSGRCRLEQARAFEMVVGGSELNVLISLSRLGMRTGLLTRLPQNDLGRLVENEARSHGVDTSPVLWAAEGRMGLYFLEQGAWPRLNRVLYDRSGSAMCQLEPGMISWEEVLPGTRLFHTTGITPALSPGCAQVTREGVQVCRRLGVTVSFDLNYRARLWSAEQARATLVPLIEQVDILFAGEEHARSILGCGARDAEGVARDLHRRFGLRVAVVPVRTEVSVMRSQWEVLAFDGQDVIRDRRYEMEVVDRVGAGDAFAAGFLYSYLRDPGDLAKALKYGNANAVLKHSIPGDYAWTSREEIEGLLAGTGGPAVNR